jgi:hypothetical protein
LLHTVPVPRERSHRSQQKCRSCVRQRMTRPLSEMILGVEWKFLETGPHRDTRWQKEDLQQHSRTCGNFSQERFRRTSRLRERLQVVQRESRGRPFVIVSFTPPTNGGCASWRFGTVDGPVTRQRNSLEQITNAYVTMGDSSQC